MMVEDAIPLSYPEWKLYIDGASGAQGFGAGIVLIGPNKVKVKYTVQIKYNDANNTAEYEALITILKLAIEVTAEHLKVYSDS